MFRPGSSATVPDFYYICWIIRLYMNRILAQTLSGVLIIGAALLLAPACSHKEELSVKTVTIDPPFVSMKEGETMEMTVTIDPEELADEEILWGSTDITVANVENGVLTAFKSGSATITATAGGVTGRCYVSVAAGDVPVTGITVEQESVTLKVGETLQMTAIVEPENATDKTVWWTSASVDIATITWTGLLTARAPGETVVTAYAGNLKASCTVKVETNRPGFIYIYNGAGWEDLWCYCTLTGGRQNAEWPGAQSVAPALIAGNRFSRFDIADLPFDGEAAALIFNDGDARLSRPFGMLVKPNERYYLYLTIKKDAQGKHVIEAIEDPEHFEPLPANVSFYEDFEDMDVWHDAWTYIDADGDGLGWKAGSSVFGTGRGYGGSNDMLVSQSYDANRGALTPDNWAFSPAIRLAASGNRVSAWLCAQDKQYPKEHWGCYVSEEIPEKEELASKCTLLYEGTMSAAPPHAVRPREQGNWHYFEWEIPKKFNDKTVHIAFRHFNCTNKFILDLDEVMVFSAQ